jgi:hypothetical protein
MFRKKSKSATLLTSNFEANDLTSIRLSSFLDANLAQVGKMWIVFDLLRISQSQCVYSGFHTQTRQRRCAIYVNSRATVFRHVPFGSCSYDLRIYSLSIFVCFNGLIISSISFWPFPAVPIIFIASFDDTRRCDIYFVIFARNCLHGAAWKGCLPLFRALFAWNLSRRDLMD